jgi:PIN domain nuclease of toxin-antitoxin system
MSDILADTHTALWSLFEPAKLSAAALPALNATQAAGDRILVSTITLIEVQYLVEKGRISPAMLAGLWATIADPNEPLATVPLTDDVARTLEKIPRGIVPDMPDRISAATAMLHKLTLVTADVKLQAAPIATVW